MSEVVRAEGSTKPHPRPWSSTSIQERADGCGPQDPGARLDLSWLPKPSGATPRLDAHINTYMCTQSHIYMYVHAHTVILTHLGNTTETHVCIHMGTDMHK